MKAVLLLLLIALITVGLWERRSIAGLREESAALRAEQAEATQLSGEIAALKESRPPAAGSTAGVDRAELLRLRGAVARLRATQADLGKLRAENERLAGELKTSSTPARPLNDEPGFIAREQWANLGNATPEAALQSIFCALRDANMDQLVALTRTAETEAMRRALQENPEAVRNDFARGIRENFMPSGYVVVSRVEIPDGRVRFKVKLSLSVEPMIMDFQRAEKGWVMINELRF